MPHKSTSFIFTLTTLLTLFSNSIALSNQFEKYVKIIQDSPDRAKRLVFVAVHYDGQKFDFHSVSDDKRVGILKNFLETKTKNIPKGDYFFSLGDVITEKDLDKDLPVLFTYATTPKLRDSKRVILIPDVEAQLGYSAVMKRARGSKTWEQKTPKVFWRGQTTGDVNGDQYSANKEELPRAKLVHFAQENPEVVDAKFTEYPQFPNNESREHFKNKYPQGSYVQIEDAVNYRYQVDIDGNGPSYSRMTWALASDSLLFKQNSPYVQWYYDRLIPGEDYVPFSSPKDLPKLRDYYETDEGKAKARIIIQNANKLAQKTFSEEAVSRAMQQALSSNGVDADLGVFPLAAKKGEAHELFVQVNRTNVGPTPFTRVEARVWSDGDKNFKLVPLTFIPKEGVWRASLEHTNYKNGPLRYDVLAYDEGGRKIYRDDSHGSLLQFPYEPDLSNVTPRKKEFAIRQTKILSPASQRFSANDEVRIQVQVENPEAAKNGFVRYTTDNWTTFHDIPLSFSEKSKHWEAVLGKFPDHTEIKLATSVTSKDNVQKWDNNEKENYSLVTGPSGMLPGEDKIIEQKKRLAKVAVPKLSREVKDYIDKHKIYVAMTSSPERLENIHHVIETLDLKRVDKVVITLPKFFKNDPKQVYSEEVIDQLKKRFGGKIEILRPDKDLGPLTKMVYTIEKVKQKDPKSIVISVDDDQGYPGGMIPELARTVILNPGSVAGGSVTDLETWKIPRFGFKEQKNKPFHLRCDPDQEMSLCDVVEGFGAIAYRAEDIDTELMKKLATLPGEGGKNSCRLSDDLVISFVLALRMIPRLRVNTEFYSVKQRESFGYGLGADALHRGSGMSEPLENEHDVNAQKYRQCYKDMVSEVYDLTTLQLKPEYQKKQETRPIVLAGEEGPRARPCYDQEDTLPIQPSKIPKIGTENWSKEIPHKNEVDLR